MEIEHAMAAWLRSLKSLPTQAKLLKALPALCRYPGQTGVALEFFILTVPFAFGHGGDHPSYVGPS